MNARYAKESIQRVLGVTADGEVGPETRAAFEKLVAYPDNAPWPPRTTAPSSLQECVVTIAEREVGVKEIEDNGGPHIREYQSATWLKPDKWPWCAAFVCWCIREAITATNPKPTFARPQTPGAWDFERWAREQGASGVLLFKPARSIRRGDIIVYTFSHIGICVGDPINGRMVTVEGNTDDDGGREGDGVYRKTRKVDLVRSVIRLG